LREGGCPRCGSPPDGRETGCVTCGRLPVELELVHSSYWFAGSAPALVHGLKYAGMRWLADFLTGLLSADRQLAQLAARTDLFCPVPLHFWRLFRRGYNQSEELALRLAALHGRKLCGDCLTRTRRTRTQTRLSPEERQANVRGAFRVRRPEQVAGLNILVIDDVMTTGATLGACTVALKNAGAANVYAYTFARA